MYGCCLIGLVVLGLATVDSETDWHQSKADDKTELMPEPSRTPEKVAADPGVKSGAATDDAVRFEALGRELGRTPSVDSTQKGEKPDDFPRGTDDTQTITPRQLSALPHRALVHISSTVATCTGWLYGPDIVLTAGHCVFNGRKWATNVVVTVLDADRAGQLRTCKRRRLYSTRGWLELEGEPEREQYDYGAIKLDCTVGSEVGWIGYGWAAKPPDLEASLSVIGYGPQNDVTPAKTVMRSGPGALKAVAESMLFYDSGTYQGSSGAPVLLGPPRDAHAVALHTKGCHQPSGTQDCIARNDNPHSGFNHGPLITREVFQNMQAWKQTAVKRAVERH